MSSAPRSVHHTPDFRAKAADDHASLGVAGAYRLLDEARQWQLAPVLRAKGAILFPHASIAVCGRQIAAAVHACLECGADRVLALGVLHALTPELRDARARVAAGGDPATEPCRGIQGPGREGRRDWEGEFSLAHFRFLLACEAARRGVAAPAVHCRYPFLAGGHPESLPGIDEVANIASDAAVVLTGDLVHHGIGYGDSPEASVFPDRGGLDLARCSIEEGLAILRRGSPADYEAHSARARSDARDVGQVLLHLRGRMDGRILDLVADDMARAYGADPPTWVACALVSLPPLAELPAT